MGDRQRHETWLRLRIWFPKGSAGSSPVIRTNRPSTANLPRRFVDDLQCVQASVIRNLHERKHELSLMVGLKVMGGPGDYAARTACLLKDVEIPLQCDSIAQD